MSSLFLAAIAAAQVVAFPKFDASTSVLVVAPHPDDEVLCCAGVIQRVLHAGGTATVVWVTSGDASELDLLVIERSLFVDPAKLRDLARKRTLEARAAASLLGVPADRQIFLGYPDQGILPILNEHYTTAYFSKYNGASAVPYDTAISPGKPYTGVSLESDLVAVLDRVKPTLVLAPSPRDSHPDHEGSGILAMRVLAGRFQLDRLRYWVVHGGETWPWPRGLHPTLALTPSPRSAGLSASAFVLTPSEEARKADALRLYETQMRVMSSFLLSYVRTNELFSTIPMPLP